MDREKLEEEEESFFSLSRVLCAVIGELKKLTLRTCSSSSPFFFPQKIRNLCPTSAGQQVTDAQELEDNLRLFLPKLQIVTYEETRLFFFFDTWQVARWLFPFRLNPNQFF